MICIKDFLTANFYPVPGLTIYVEAFETGLMYLRHSIFHTLLLSLLLISMLIPAAQADFMVGSEPASQQQAMDCHDEHDVHAQHQHSTDCAQSCDCAATGCHTNAALSQHNQAATTPLIANKLTAFSEQTVSPSPGKFERPPRS